MDARRKAVQTSIRQISTQFPFLEVSQAEELSAKTLDRRDRFTSDDIRLGGLGRREAKVLRGKPR
jgi:hypothetical protein